MLGALAAHAAARPGAAVVDTCLRTVSTSPNVRYIPIAADAFQVTEDEEAGETDIALQYGRDTVGTWEVKTPQAFGLLFNGKKTPLARVVRLDKDKPPAAFNTYEAIWGEAREGRHSYICATFNLDGPGKSGRFQNVRGLYLIDRRARNGVTYYTLGHVGAAGK